MNDFLVRKILQVLQVFWDLQRLTEGAVLVTADFVGLYPHIPNEVGSSAMREALGRLQQSAIPAEALMDLARIVLLSNNLTFNGKHYVQILGTAIGTTMTPSYASIFVETLELDLLGPLQSQFSGDFSTIFFGVYEFIS